MRASCGSCRLQTCCILLRTTRRPPVACSGSWPLGTPRSGNATSAETYTPRLRRGVSLVHEPEHRYGGQRRPGCLPAPGRRRVFRSNAAARVQCRSQQALGALLAVTGSTRNSVRASAYPRPRHPGAAGRPTSCSRAIPRRVSLLVETDTSGPLRRVYRRLPTGARLCAVRLRSMRRLRALRG